MGAVKLWVALLFVCLKAFAAPQSPPALGPFLGERPFPDYFGPRDPLGRIHPHTNTTVFWDQDELDRGLFDGNLQEAREFLLRELPPSILCPKQYLESNSSEVRYLTRLSFLSFLFDSINHHGAVVKGHQLRAPSCEPQWKKVLKSCKPKGADMKKFIERAQSFLEDKSKQHVPPYAGPRSLNDWWGLPEKDLTRIRMGQHCISGGPCNVRGEGVPFENICAEELSWFERICSEQDQIYGLSDFPKLNELLEKSHAFVLINSENLGSGCLKRYTEIYAPREVYPKALRRSFEHWLDTRKLGERYLLGELFLPGSLKEFDQKGLGQFLFAPKVVKVLPTPTPTPKPIIVPTPIPTPVPTPVPTATLALPTPTPTPSLPTLSYFGQMVERREREQLLKLSLDMELFEKDSAFTAEQLKSFEKGLSQYLNQKSLQRFKDKEALGTAKNPVPVMLIKYLLEHKKFQALFNIQRVMGNRFYVLNDLDGGGREVFVEMSYDNPRKRWSLHLLIPPG